MPTIYQAQEEIDRTPERWAQGIKDLHEGLNLSTPAAIAAAEGAAASTTSFHLAYQGRNDLALLTQFGGLLRRIAKARYPDLPDVLPRRRLPDSERIRVGFLSSHFYAHSVYRTHGRWITRLDKRRFDVQAFSQYGLSADARCVIHPRTSHPEFLRLNQMTDIALDSARWSGCNSTLDAITCGLPVVTLPGAMMRGRHSYAILKMIGVDETIARNEDDYVEIAVKLARNRPWRDDIAGNIRRTAPRAFDDPAPIRALETFFESVCRGPG